MYWHFESTSWCCGARNRNLGSGEILNGLSFNPKNASYIDLLNNGSSSYTISRNGSLLSTVSQNGPV
jgi:hypothetical protein